MNAIKLVIVAAVIGFFVAACSQTSQTPNTAANTTKPAPAASAATDTASSSPADTLASGAGLYAKNCQICHRDTGKGGKITVEGKKLNPADLTSDKIKKRDDNKLLEDVKEGVPDEGMPAFKDKLSADQIKQIIQHVRKLQAGQGAPATS